MDPITYLKARRQANLLAVLIWMLVIFAGSATPEYDIPSAVHPLAKVLHVLEYSVLGLLLMPYMSTSRWPLTFVLLAAAAYAASDEYHQLYVPGRHSSPVDVMIDSFGSIVGASVAKMWGGL